MSPVSAFTSRRARHLLLGAAILSATVLACFPVTPDAHAATGACTSEPIWTLSNGDLLDTTANVSADPGVVTNVNYSVKLPAGITVVAGPVDNAHPPVLAPKTTYSYNNGTTAGNYSVGVQVSGTQASVTVSTDLVSAKKVVSSNSASGSTNQTLWTSVSG